MSSAKELIEKEEHFHKLNQELEIKTALLMKEIENVMKGPILPKNDDETRTSLIHGEKREKSTELKQKAKIEKIARTDDFLPKTKNVEITDPEAMAKFLGAKIQILQRDLYESTKALAEKEAKIVLLTSSNKSLQETNMRLTNQMTTLRNQYTKQDTKFSELTKKLECSDRDYKSLNRDFDSLKSEVKSSASRTTSASQRIARLIEDNDKLKKELAIAKQDEKDLRETARKQCEAISSTLKKAEHQKKDALLAFRKQSQLVDNVRRQNVLLAAEKCLDFTEKDYIKLLNWESISDSNSTSISKSE